MASNGLEKKAKDFAKKALPDTMVSRLSGRRYRKKHTAGRYQGSSTYTVVSAVYNVEDYLDEYFSSLYNQTMGRENIRVIAVDDGSTDGSAQVIKRWQEQWPGAITYLKKENGGQASARNLGLQQVDTEWVTFIDPDDFVSQTYFETVDKAIVGRPSLQMIGCNLIYWREEKQIFANTHLLSYRFDKGDSFFAYDDENMHMQLSVAVAFFRMAPIREAHLTFDERIRPVFEDAVFVDEYLLNLKEGSVGFLKKAEYYYRKRGGQDSTLNTSWSSSGRVVTVPRYGWLGLLQYAKETKGYVPAYTQNVVLYDLCWVIKHYLGYQERGRAIQGAGDDKTFFSLLRETFSYIDRDVLFNFPDRFLNFSTKVYLTQLVGTMNPPYQIVELKRVDLTKREFLVETVDSTITFYLNNKEVSPVERKEVDSWFFSAEPLKRYELRIPYENADQVLSFQWPGEGSVKLAVRDKQFADNVRVQEAIDCFTAEWTRYKQEGNTWIIMDRGAQADDNGEHFYRYMMNNHPEQHCLFALQHDAPDWERLKNEGFNLVDFGSSQFERELKACSKLISAHADKFIHSYFGDNFYESKDFVFLQHGVTKDNISNWINNKPITLMVTATPQEYESIVSDGSPYVLTASQVTLSGFPRHDALLAREKDAAGSNSILIAPTWRKYLTGDSEKKGDNRSLVSCFADSEYKQAWEEFLNSSRLAEVAEKSGKKVIFFPHANILPYVEAGMFSIPSYIEIGKLEGGNSIQEFFVNASVLVTDYSSVAFEVAYLNKPCIYYQFDVEQMFSGDHIYGKGYFDYKRDGFGPVAATEAEVLDALEDIAECGFEPLEEYKRRMDETFIFRDGKCCERVYKAIKALDEPRS